MGNCCSTSDIKTPKTPRILPPSKSPPQPHSFLEEETVVKEVLAESETRPIIPRARIINPSPFIRSAPLLADSHKPIKHKSGNDELSEEISEICSSISASSKLTENEDFHEVRHRSPKIRNRTFSGELKRDKTVGISPSRRADPSPRRVKPGDGLVRKRDNGESSRRRSRSPVTRVDVGSCKPSLDRSQSARRTGKSPSRVGSGLERERIRKDNWPPPTASNESLDNPLVSLECFIFL